jgi:hypothetical protein
MAGPVHYEIYIRKTAPAPWSLYQATENRKQATETAEDLLKDGYAAAVRVTKETLDPETMEFQSITVLTRGAPEVEKRRVERDEAYHPICSNPADLYTPHARDLIAGVLEDWLSRNGVTAFELLHRPDLAEKLEASGVEMQHAIQKVAIPEAQQSGRPVHELIRHYQKLAESTVERIIVAGRKGRVADLSRDSLTNLAARLAGDPDRAFLMGCALAAAVATARGARAKLGRLMDLADQAPPDGAARAMCMVGIEQMLCELLASRARLTEIVGPGLDIGGGLAAIVCMVAPREIARLSAHDARFALQVPLVDGPAERLGERLAGGEFPLLAASLARQVLRELMGPRRLRPGDAVGEIEILRTLATALTAAAGRLLTLEEVQNAFVERSKSLVTADFVGSYVAGCPSVLAEAEALVRLCENVTGASNKRSAARWLAAAVGALRFETELRASSATPAQKLALLAALQRGVRVSQLSEHDEAEIAGRIGVAAGAVESDARLLAQVSRASASPTQKLSVLLKLASGESAPLGPVADRARAEVIRLLRTPAAREALAAAPEQLSTLRPMMKAVGLAA